MMRLCSKQGCNQVFFIISTKGNTPSDVIACEAGQNGDDVVLSPESDNCPSCRTTYQKDTWVSATRSIPKSLINGLVTAF